jgi:hypothetical protein
MLMRIADLPARYRKHFLGTPDARRLCAPPRGRGASRPAEPVPNEEDDDACRQAAVYRAVFISDLHLGTPGCQAGAAGLPEGPPQRHLYLVGDIVDGWQLRRAGTGRRPTTTWCKSCCARARKGCRVVYVPGNHDEFAREFIGHQFGGIEVREEAVHPPPTAARCGSSTATTLTA